MTTSSAARRSHPPKTNGSAAPAEPQPKTAPELPPCKHSTPEETDAHATQIVRSRQCAIIQACCAQAEQGSYLHAKFVFDFAGIAPALRPDPAVEAHERSLAEELLMRLNDQEFCRQLTAAQREFPVE